MQSILPFLLQQPLPLQGEGTTYKNFVETHHIINYLPLLFQKELFKDIVQIYLQSWRIEFQSAWRKFLKELSLGLTFPERGRLHSKIMQAWIRCSGGTPDRQKISGKELLAFYPENISILKGVGGFLREQTPYEEPPTIIESLENFIKNSLKEQVPLPLLTLLHNDVCFSPKENKALNFYHESDITRIPDTLFHSEIHIYSDHPLVAFAYPALFHVVSETPFSNNYWREEVEFTLPYCDTHALNLNRHDLGPSPGSKYFSPHANLFRRIRCISHFTKSALVANCFTLASRLFFCLARWRLSDLRIELVSFHRSTGDHSFVVIDRKREDITNLNESLVIDPWSRKMFDGKDICKHLENYYGVRRDLTPYLEPFNPNQHRLISEISSLFLVQDFKIASSQSLPQITLSLEKYYALTRHKDKIKQAKIILGLVRRALRLNNINRIRNVALNTLYSQLSYLTKKDI